MSVRELLRNWENHASGAVTDEAYTVRLPLEAAAKIAALGQMYPRRTEEQIIAELLTAALDDLENNLPYEQGKRVVSFDEEGDPVYEDAGPTPTFLELSRQHLSRLRQQKSN
jgi:predicted DNA-binding protein